MRPFARRISISRALLIVRRRSTVGRDVADLQRREMRSRCSRRGTNPATDRCRRSCRAAGPGRVACSPRLMSDSSPACRRSQSVGSGLPATRARTALQVFGGTNGREAPRLAGLRVLEPVLAQRPDVAGRLMRQVERRGPARRVDHHRGVQVFVPGEVVEVVVLAEADARLGLAPAEQHDRALPHLLRERGAPRRELRRRVAQALGPEVERQEGDGEQGKRNDDSLGLHGQLLCAPGPY